MAIPDDKLAALEAQRAKLTTSEARWLDQITEVWTNKSRPIPAREWNRVGQLAAEASAR